jgi:hypothetical protein
MLIVVAPSNKGCIKYILLKEPNIFIRNNDVVSGSFYKRTELFEHPDRFGTLIFCGRYFL